MDTGLDEERWMVSRVLVSACRALDKSLCYEFWVHWSTLLCESRGFHAEEELGCMYVVPAGMGVCDGA